MIDGKVQLVTDFQISDAVCQDDNIVGIGLGLGKNQYGYNIEGQVTVTDNAKK